MDVLTALSRVDTLDGFGDSAAEDMPRPASLAMPRQSWISRSGRWTQSPPTYRADGLPKTSPVGIGARRWAFFSATVALTAVTMIVPAHLYNRDGFEPLEVAAFVLLGVLLLALSCWFCNAVVGMAMLVTGRGVNPLGIPDTAPSPQGRTALLMPIYNEDPEAAVGRLRAVEANLAALGAASHFDIFILSDTRSPEGRQAEHAAYRAFKREAQCPVYFRVRPENHERKVGNVSDWIRRHGAAYEYFLVLDADSTMSGATLLKLVDTMARHPGVGLIQTAPTIVGASTLFARASQFGVRLYGRVAAMGLSWWCGSEALYWGHNAIIRTRAFAASSGLSQIDGPRPFGGEVLSHDVVESALLRRSGWAVHLAPTLDGSHEETPPGLLDFMKRERRWCQGNLQHLALIRAPGLHWLSRLQFVMGAMAYLASPLWLASLLVGLAIELQDPVDWGAFWYILTPRVTPLLWGSLLSGLLLLGPKILGLALVLSRPHERAAYGGLKALLKSAALEAMLSVVTAPLLMVSNTRMVIAALSGRDAGWSAQRRTAGRLGLREAAAQHRWEIAVGLGLCVALSVRPDLSLLFSPIVLPLLLAAPLGAVISRADIGEAARRRCLMATPEELGASAPAHTLAPPMAAAAPAAA